MSTITPYTYNAHVDSVHDGDTLTVTVDLGFETYRTQIVRLVGINARELSQPGGKEAHVHLAELAQLEDVTLISVSYDKYGNRVDGDVLLNGESLSQRMIKDGYAAAWNGKGKAPLAPWPIPATS